ncbi:MAG: ribose 5-phosphate isomerase B, ribose 5-phosphate isomerase B [Candidatus Peregrinibacteria bacterium GW2011_GWF2_33_10]|nr:MAG: ribose 5-phosphate isomerase B, ribose 5-phosphate isomerase B [Candidatus Peregrinibacteria bacterium GW2011_GWF2_33_10]OGJ44489.1 MAG: ribose 5-phosphate isomerase B [Candidatus Peregrinibacteria bacterium RIFOXYA12_FULL_33_12]OGJ44793.1 MAG: ribose 5-phosphate isomerase B [Candidatus Peregrinibacteria bacterium RIFOXYA2_FULL_33_21]OGJ50479.1 MAG: ribose 5-phosphate isomerase B [Candidatus Peregrinibacteria bacterium RIFOXYB2_FULL_33_20]
MQIYIGSDQGAFELKEVLKKYLEGKNYEVADEGCYSLDSVDYPDIAKKVALKINSNPQAKGILMCGTGIGISISANKVPGIRAALCTDEYMARMAREHNDAQILCMGGRVVGTDLAKSIADVFLHTDFSNLDRHKRRIEKME